MKPHVWTTALLGLFVVGANAAPDSPPATALADYVAEPDSTFRFDVRRRFAPEGAEVVELRLHSQTWKGTLWKHQLYLIKPDNVDMDSPQGVLVIGGGRWRPEYDVDADAATGAGTLLPAEELPEDSEIFIAIAQELGAVVAVLAQVPFQPLFGLTEDELIAHTFERYLETGDAEWPLLLPMVKSVSRAMDSTQALASEEWNIGLERFTVLGGSKRGWTTWLVGAVDERAGALMPIVIDVLNVERHMPHQEAIWGTLSTELAPYSRRGLHTLLSTEEGSALRRIVDPYSYRARLTQSKLISIATNDAYFPNDSLNFYWNGLPDPKHVLYLPNEGHDAEDFERLVPALAALHRNSAAGRPLPELRWQFAQAERGLRLCLSADSLPEEVTLWTAESDDTDFRDNEFVPEDMSPREGVLSLDVPAPAFGYKAVFAEAVLDDGEGPFAQSTNLRVMDDEGRPLPGAGAVEGRRGVCE